MIYILTIGGENLGFGHLARCLPIFEALKNAGESPVFIVNGDHSVRAILEEDLYRLLEWMDIEQFKQLNLASEDMVIVDCLTLPDEHLKILASSVKRIYIIDDSFDNNYTAGTVINWRVGAAATTNVSSSSATYLLGEQYAPIRKEILRFRERKIKRAVKRILITLGGSDIRNLTPEIINTIARYNDQLHLDVIIGGAFKNIEQFNNHNFSENVSFYFSPDVKQLYQLMFDADIAVAAGGHSIYELAYTGTPTIHLFAVDNQKPAEAWNDSGFTFNAGWYFDGSFLKNIEKGITFFSTIEHRIMSSKRGQELIDGKGAERIANQIIARIA